MPKDEIDAGLQNGPLPAATDTGAAGPAPAPRPEAGPARRSAAPGARTRTVVRVLSALALLAAGGSLAVAAAVTPSAASSRPLAAPLVPVPAGSSIALCPAPPRLLEGAPVGTDPQFSPVSGTATSAVAAVVLSSPAGTVPASRLAALAGGPLVQIAAGSPAAPATSGPPVLVAGAVPQHGVDAVSVLSADAQAGRQAAAAAVLSYTAEDGDLRGTAALTCQQPGNDMWLLGANTAVGRSAVLHLSNASATPATVSLELFGSKGQVQAPGSRGLLVPPGTSRAIILAGLAPGQEHLSVRVLSAGGPVAAVIQQSVLRGLTPGGVDFIGAAAAPAARQVLTGIDVQEQAGLAELTAKPGFADAGPVLELTVPGPVDAVVNLKLFGRDGAKALPGGGVVTAKAGAVTSVPLAGLPAGAYTLAADSDVSFTAAARVTRGLNSDEPTDVAYAAAAARLGSQHVVPLPRAGERYLVFGAPDGRARITYSTITSDGKIRAAGTADIAGGTTASIKVPADTDGAAVVGYLVSAAGDPAYGAILLEAEGRADIALSPLPAEAAGQEQVPVTIGY